MHIIIHQLGIYKLKEKEAILDESTVYGPLGNQNKKKENDC